MTTKNLSGEFTIPKYYVGEAGSTALRFLYVDKIGELTVKVAYGVVGNISPSNIETEAVLTNQAEIWLKVTIASSGFNKFIVSDVIIESGPITPNSDPPNETTGDPGEFFYIKLAEIEYDNGAISIIKNTGNGSFGFALEIVGRKCVQGVDPDPDTIIDVKDIVFYRMQT